jgi:hypothetical protein
MFVSRNEALQTGSPAEPTNFFFQWHSGNELLTAARNINQGTGVHPERLECGASFRG